MRDKRNRGDWRPPGAPCDDAHGPDRHPDIHDIMEKPAVLGGPAWLQRVLKPRSPLAILLTLMALGVVIMAYTEGDPRRAIRLDPPWQPGEISRLEARDPGGHVLVTWQLNVESHGSQTVLITDREAAGFRERATVFADPHTLIPTRTEFERESAQGNVISYVAEYGSEDVTIRADIPLGHEEATMQLPERPFYDDEQLLMVIRALPLSKSFRGTIRSVVTRAGAQDKLILRVRGRESVSVQAGHFETWKVEIAGTDQSAWIAVAPPHQLVRYENRKTGILSELVEYAEGASAPTDE
ncbi:MAG TPA: hypothetical protein PKM31_10250 [Bacillota bacterium]|nr:hypothetical protein [Bacillota bacterium]